MYTIYFKNQEIEFYSIYEWNTAIFSILFEDQNLTSVKDGFGGCNIY